MEFVDDVLKISNFLALTVGMIVLFVGKYLNEKLAFLRRFTIPEPVSGGLLFSLVIAIIYWTFGIEISFSMAARDALIVYFFTTIGLNAQFSDLIKGGRPLVILLVITIVFMVLQDLAGIGTALALGLEPAFGLLASSVSLTGGHGTAIAWAPIFETQYGVERAMEIGVASATFGLIFASMIGGPIARYFIEKYQLSPMASEKMDIGVKDDNQQESAVSYLGFLRALLAIHISIILGSILHFTLEQYGVMLPLFVNCLFAAILLTNLVPLVLKKKTLWPTRTPSIALIGDIALGLFLAMSLMSMQLWTLLQLAGPMMAILLVQLLLAVGYNFLVVFRAMGKNYDAAVISAGFGGISLGATPTAIVNMTAVTKKYGPANMAFIVLPLVSAFFMDLVNSFLINFMLNNFV